MKETENATIHQQKDWSLRSAHQKAAKDVYGSISGEMDRNFNLRRPTGGRGWSNPPHAFLWITFLRVKQNQQDIAYSHLDKEQIGKSSKISNMSRKYGRDRWKLEGTVEE